MPSQLNYNSRIKHSDDKGVVTFYRADNAIGISSYDMSLFATSELTQHARDAAETDLFARHPVLAAYSTARGVLRGLGDGDITWLPDHEITLI